MYARFSKELKKLTSKREVLDYARKLVKCGTTKEFLLEVGFSQDIISKVGGDK